MEFSQTLDDGLHILLNTLYLHQMRRSKCQDPIMAPAVMSSSSQELRAALSGRSHTSSHTRMTAQHSTADWGSIIAGEARTAIQIATHRRAGIWRRKAQLLEL